MKRKVIQIAGSTQLVSLPRDWSIQHNVQKGDELEVEAQGNRVVVSIDKAVEKFKRAEIDVTELVPIVQRVLGAFYKKGYDEIVVKFASPEVLNSVQHLLQNEIIGYEIVDQKPDHCTIRAIARGAETEFDPILRRTFLLLKAFLEGIVEALDAGDASRISVLRAMESSNNKYSSFCRRLINKMGRDEHWKTSLAYAIVEELEKIADEAKYLCDYLLESKKNINKANKQIKELYREVSGLFEGCYTLYYSPDVKKTAVYLAKRKKIIKSALQFLAKPCSQSRFAHYIMTMSQQIANVINLEMELTL